MFGDFDELKRMKRDKSENLITTSIVIITGWKVSVFEVFLVCNFSHSDWIRRDTPYSVRIRGNTVQKNSEYGYFLRSVLARVTSYLHVALQYLQHHKNIKTSIILCIVFFFTHHESIKTSIILCIVFFRIVFLPVQPYQLSILS